MTNVLLDLIPDFVSDEQVSESSILSGLSILNTTYGFRDVLNNGKLLYEKVLKAENDCKRRNIPPLSFRVQIPPETHTNLLELAKQARIGVPSAAKVTFYRSLENGKSKVSSMSVAVIPHFF